jgi:uncharacterized protein
VSLLVIGVSDDSQGCISAARAAGIPIVVADVSPPEYVRAGDYYTEATADLILSAIMETTFPGPISISRPVASPSADATLGVPALWETLLRSAPGAHSSIHGPRHWLETAALAFMLLPDCPGADPTTVLLFALLHDSQRLQDADDPDHGRRAAHLVSGIDRQYVWLTEWQRSRLEQACALHADGFVTSDATVGLCWDADRLGLWRIGHAPDPDRLCLPASRTRECLLASKALLLRDLEWRPIFDAYAKASAVRRS